VFDFQQTLGLTPAQGGIFALLAALLGLLMWGRWRYDVVAFLALITAVATGLVPAEASFSGFGHPATITVAFVLIISRTLASAGAVDWAAALIRPAAKRTSTHIAALSSLAAALSGFMNNVGTLGLLMPVALQSARKAGRSAALILMPLSFGSILGGLITLIGTPPNIIIASYRGLTAGEPFGMFDFTPVGAVAAIAGLAFVALIGWRLVPRAAAERAATEELFDIENYLTEVRVTEDSKALGKTLVEIRKENQDIDALIIGVVRDERMLPGAARWLQLEVGDRLLVEAGPDEIDKFASTLGVAFSGQNDHDGEKTEIEDSVTKKKSKQSRLSSEDGIVIEAVIAPGSRLDGLTVQSQSILSRHGFTLLAVSRQGKPYRGRLHAFRFEIGDVLLLHGEAARAPEALTAFGCLPLAERGVSMGQRHTAGALIAIFGAAILASSFGLLPIAVSLGAAITVMVLFGLLPLRQLYEGIDWPVIVLLGALIPVGGALESTGATNVIADAILALTAGGSPVMILALIMVVTMTLSDLLNNAATAVVMAPIGAGIAERLSVSADPFLMAIAIGASCAFLTPIGHQNNALIMGPGGYRFGDYWRMGLPLELVIIATALPMILWIWPL
jgi:di/tricarboxylate transporter